MISIKSTSLLALCLVLAACGGGGDDDGYVAPACAAPCEPFQAYGDSTMVAGKIPGRMLQASLAPEGFNVIDGAVNGSTTADLIGWLPAGLTGPALTNHGMNDCRFNFGVEAYRANLRTLVGMGINILETPNPTTEKDCSGYAQVMREVAAEKGVLLVDTWAFVHTLPGFLAHIPDGVHPDQWLTIEIAKNRSAVLLAAI